MTARREFFEQEAAMYREATTEVYGFRPSPTQIVVGAVGRLVADMVAVGRNG